MGEKSFSERSSLPSCRYTKGRALADRAHAVIPGGCHTYAKGDDQYPLEAPAFIERGNGCRVWDVDGNEFIEYGMGLRSVTLGHAYDAVVNAAQHQMHFGSNFNRPSPLEVECAEKFLSLIRGADMVKFTKDGSAALDGGLKLARAFTGRDKVAICADHPFFSSSDWFIGSTGIPGGVPKWVQEHTVKFHYNDLQSLEGLFATYPGQIACVVLEPARNVEPAGDFLSRVKACCHQHGALLMLDEMITGFRWHLRGAQHVYRVEPDLSCFGKALGNGFAISALAGRREVMEQGGLRSERERVFLLSTTHGAETHALAAAIAVMRVYETEPVIETLYSRGQRLWDGVLKVTEELALRDHFQLSGRPCCLFYATLDESGTPSQGFRTLFLQEALRRGLLAPSFVTSYSHSEADIDTTIDAVGEALRVYKKALEDGLDKHLKGPAVKPVYRRFA
jgi:glutamate-1-semialdehyde 2,1-aminomutase